MANIPKSEQKEAVPFIDMEFVSKEEKQSLDYSRKILNSVFSFYRFEKTELSWRFDTKVDELRAIGQGRQTPDYYKRYYDGNDPKDINVSSDVDTYLVNSSDASRYGWMTIIEDNLSPIANVKTIIKDRVNQARFDVKASAVDMNAIDEEDKRMTEAYVKAKYKEQLAFMRSQWELPDSQQHVITDEYSDLLEIKRQGGFKQHFITALEQLISWTEQYSDWEDHLVERFFDDLFDTSYAFAYADYDDMTGRPTWKWIDVKDVVVQQSNKHDFSDINYGGFFDYPSINDLRGDVPLHNGDKEISTKEEWYDLAKSFAEYNGNPSKQEIDKLELEEPSFSGKTGSASVCRLTLWWKDYEETKEVEYKNPYGAKKRRAYKDGENVAKGDRLIVNRVEKLYYARQIVGTDWMQNWGPMPNMPRKNLKEVQWPFVGVKLMEKSFTERVAPLAHIFGLAWYRLCNGIAKAQNDGYAIDIQSIIDMDDGEKTMPWSDMLKMWREEGIFLFDSSRTQLPGGGSGLPIAPVPGTALENMTKELALMDAMYAKIEQLIGVPPVALGVSPEQKQAVRNTQLSVASSNSSINMLVTMVMRVKKKLSGATCSMWQNVIKYNERCRKDASKVIGSDDIDAILKARNDFMEYGIELEPRPSTEMIDVFVDLIRQEIARKNQGQAGIDSIDGMMLINQLTHGGNFYDAMYRAKYLKEQDEKRLEREKMAAIQAQGKSIDQNAKTAADEDRKTEQQKFQQAQQEKVLEVEGEKEINRDKFGHELALLEREMELKRQEAEKLNINA